MAYYLNINFVKKEKIMKNIKILLSMILIANFSYLNAQKCNVTNDEFTKEKIVSYDFNNRVVYYELKNDTIRLEMVFNYNGECNVFIPKGTELLFKLENQEIIKLNTFMDAAPNTNVSGNTVITKYSYKMVISKEQIANLATSKIILLRYPDAKGGYLDYQFKGFGKILSNILLKGAECIKSNL